MDELGFRYLNLYPSELDSLSLCYFFNALSWSLRERRAKEEAAWRQSALIAQAVYNWGGAGMKPKALFWLYDKLFGGGGIAKTTFQKIRDMTITEFRSAMKLLKSRGKDRRKREAQKARNDGTEGI